MVYGFRTRLRTHTQVRERKMYGVRVNVDFVVRKIDGHGIFFKDGVRTGKGTGEISSQNMVRITGRVREFSEMPSTGREFPT